jgi:hypothetical protein
MPPPGIKCSEIQYNDSIFNSIIYFNVLTQQLQEPITESAQEDEIYT